MTNDYIFLFCPLTPERTFYLYSNVQDYIFYLKHKKRWTNRIAIKGLLS